MIRSIGIYFLETTWARIAAITSILVLLIFIAGPYDSMNAKLKSAGFFLAILGWMIIHNRLLIEKFLFTKKYIAYCIGILLGLAGFGVLIQITTQKPLDLYFIISTLGSFVYYTLIGVIGYFAFKYFITQRTMLKEKLLAKELELKYLNAQLNPHFLFNALNNIYSHSFHNSSQTSELIMKLSEMLRFILEYGKREKIQLRDEVDFINNYLAFEKERLGDRCIIVFENRISNPDIELTPFLFFPFIENAVKHGTNSIEQCEISIFIVQVENNLQLSVKNTMAMEAEAGTKVGIENARKRLELHYGNNYKLDFSPKGNEFEVKLEVELF